MDKLRLGTATSDITPPLGVGIPGSFEARWAEDVHDPLFAKAMVFEAGDQHAALVVCDVICLLEQDTKWAKHRAEELTGIPADNIMISATHTHYGPATVTIFNTKRDEDYCDWMAGQIAQAIRRAQLSLRSVVMGYGRAMIPEEVHNRRWYMKDGSVVTNPGYLNPKRVRPAGPTDPELGLLAFMTPEGEPAGALMNYALHYVGGPYPNTITADYFGFATAALPRMWGKDFLAILANGACGDINNCNFDEPAPEYPDPFYQSRRVGNVVATEAFKAWQQIEQWTDDIAVNAAFEYSVFRRRQLSLEQEQQMAKLLAGPPQPDNSEWVYANERRRLAQEPVQRPVLIQVLHLGDVAIVGLPGEVFVEIGLAIKRQSPFPYTMVIELANDWLGYIPTDQALNEGGYETELAASAKAAPGTAAQWIQSAVGLLHELHRAHS